MITRNILKDFASERQPNMQLLNIKDKNWRLYFRRVPIIPEPSDNPPDQWQSGDNSTGQWQADYVPQPGQMSVISDTEPDVSAFILLLKDAGFTDDEINMIISDCE
jgi:hypothetical protein